MAIAKRIFLFVLMNLLVITVISVLIQVLGLESWIAQSGSSYTGLMIMCLMFGMGGAFISLQMSRWMAKRAMGVQVIDPNTSDPYLQDYVQRVHHYSKAAGLSTMPEVGIYESPEVNAFATGPSKSRSLVAVSSGLLQRMDKDSADGVIAHEVAHIANGDMVTMTLVQGVVNAFVMFLARAIAIAIDNFMRSDDREGGGLGGLAYFGVVFVLQTILMIPGMLVINAFSRHREFRADEGSARIGGRDNMIKALRTLKATFEVEDPHHQEQSLATLKISGHDRGFSRFFSTHPSLDDRIARLEQLPYA